MGWFEHLLIGDGREPFDWNVSKLQLKKGDVICFNLQDYIVIGKVAYRDSGWDRCLYHLINGSERCCLMEELFGSEKITYLQPVFPPERLQGERSHKISTTDGNYFCRKHGLARAAEIEHSS